jgi:hypothetical protein
LGIITRVIVVWLVREALTRKGSREDILYSNESGWSILSMLTGIPEYPMLVAVFIHQWYLSGWPGGFSSSPLKEK